MTALTGETGAGKTIILESLHLLFGKRADQHMIRHQATRAYVSGVFKLSKYQQEKLDLPEIITIERTLDANGRHDMRLNKEIVTVQKVKDVMQAVGSIHSQGETLQLLDKSSYLNFIDQVDEEKTNDLLNKYLIKRSDYLDKQKKLNQLKNKRQESIQKKEFLEYHLNELKSLNLVLGEKLKLNDEVEKLKNYDKLSQQLKIANQALDNEVLSIDLVYEAAKALEKIASLDDTYKQLQERLLNVYYETEDVKDELKNVFNSLDYQEDHFNLMQERIYEITRIEQKYQKNEHELINYLEEIEEELNLITDYDGYLKQVTDDANKAFDLAYEAGIKLSDLRKKLSKTLITDVLFVLKDLDLEKAKITILFEDTNKELFETGIDQVEFLISLNEGEIEKPLAKIASGGERARFMLALKSIYALKNKLSLLVLDEIDIGISGKTAAKVANKMSELSNDMQVLVITHLPQVAAKAKYHYQIYKEKANNRMVTRLKELEGQNRIEKLALMLSDDKISTFAIEQAKVLLKK
jgi:DNA repair protein RecN (Recombination protein N)